MFDNRFKLHKYEHAASNSVVLNVNQLEHFTWLELPHDIGKFLSLYNIQEFNTSNGSVDIEYTDKVTRDCLKPWLRIETALLNTECGFHMYKFQFVDTRTSDAISLYFAYNLQNDNPDKTSYIYMKNRNASGHNPFESSDDPNSDSGSSSGSNFNPDSNDSSTCPCYNCCNCQNKMK